MKFLKILSILILTIVLTGSTTTKETTKNPSKQTYLPLKNTTKTYTLTEIKRGQHGAKTRLITAFKNDDIPKQEDKPKRENQTQQKYREMEVIATAYVSFCDTGCIGITATGTDVRETIKHPTGYGIVAVDPSVIPLGSVVEIDGEKYIADDTGGAIKGKRIDILVHTHDEQKAYEFGKKKIKIKIYNSN